MPWIIGGASIVGGLLGSSGSKKAANAQQQAAAQATAEDRRQYDISRADLAPYREAGSEAVNRLRALLGIGDRGKTIDQIAAELRNSGQFKPASTGGSIFDRVRSSMAPPDEAALMAEARRLYEAQPEGAPAPVDIMEMDPGYQFRLNEGLNATKNSAVAGGRLDSGATLKALTRFGQDYASGEFNNVFNRLSGVAGTGQNATNQTVAAGANMANNISNSIIGAGNARAAGIVGGSNAWSDAANGVASAYNNNQSNKRLEALLRGNSNSNANYSFTPTYTGYGINGDYQYG